MIATVKLIPFGVEAESVRCGGGGGEHAARCSVAPYTIKRVGIVSTLLPGLAPKVVEKTLRVTADRLAPAGATIIAERRVAHDEAALAAVDQGIARARRRAGDRVRRFRDRRPARRDPGGDLGRSAARSSISACRSIPAICC